MLRDLNLQGIKAIVLMKNIILKGILKNSAHVIFQPYFSITGAFKQDQAPSIVHLHPESSIPEVTSKKVLHPKSSRPFI